MAFSAREVIMVFRGQNYLSGAMRRIGRDVNALNASQLQQQSRQLAINRQRIDQQRRIAEAERGSLVTGSRNISLQARKAGLDDKAIARQIRLKDLYANHNSLLSRQLGNITRIQQIEAIAARRKGFSLSPVLPPGVSKAQQAKLEAAFTEAQSVAITKANAPPMRTLPKNLRNLTEEQLSMAYSKELLLQDELQQKLQTNIEKRQRLIQTIKMQSLEEQKIAAVTAEEAARVQLLTDRLETLNLADKKQIASQRELALAMQRMPFEKFQNGASRIEHAGRLIQMVGLIGAAGIGYMANAAASFNTTMVQAATQSTTAMNNTTAQVVKNSKYLQATVTQLLSSGKTVAAPSDLSNALYQIFSGLSFKGGQLSQLKQGTAILKDFNKLYTANYGQVQFNDIVSAGINLMNNFRLKANQLPKVLNTMQASVRFGALGMGQFVGSLSQVVPAFRSAHYSFTQLAQDVAFVSRLFPQSIRTGTTGLARLTEMFSRANTIQGVKQQFGVNIAPGGKLLPIVKILQEIEKARPGVFSTSLAIGNFFKQVSGTQGTIQARRVLAGYVQEMGLYHTVAKQVAGDGNEVNKSLRAMAQTPGVKWEAFKNQIRAVTLELGAGAIPAFRAFAKPIEQVVKWFDSLSPSTKRAVGYFLGVAAIGTLLVGTFMAIVGAIGRVGAMLAWLVKERGLAKLAEEGGFINARFALMLGTVGALIFVFMKFHTQAMAVINAFGGLQNVLEAVSIVIGILTFRSLIASLATVATSFGIAEESALAFRGALMSLPVAAGVAAGALLGLTIKKFFGGGKKRPQLGESSLGAAAEKQGLGLPFEDIRKRYAAAYDSFKMVNKGRGTGFVKELDLYSKSVNHAVNSIIRQMLRLKGQPASKLLGNMGLYKMLEQETGLSLNKLETLVIGIRHMHLKTIAAFSKTVDEWPQLVKKYERDQALGTKGDQRADLLKLRSSMLMYLKLHKLGLAGGVPNERVYQQLMMIRNALAGLPGAAHKLNTELNKNKNSLRSVTVAARQYGTTATHAFQKAYQAYRLAAQAVKADPKNLQKQIALQNALMALQAVATKQQLAAAKKTVSAITSGNNQISNSTKTTYADMFNSIESMYEQFKSTEETIFGTLFQGPFINSPFMQNQLQYGYKLTGRDLLKDLSSQLVAFKKYHKDIDNLRRRGAPEALIQQLMALGPDAAKQIHALSTLSGPELRRYFKMFGDEQKLVNKQTLRDLNRQLGSYKKFGRNVGRAMAAGIQQESPAIEKAIKKMIMDAFPGLKGAPHGGGRNQHGGNEQHIHHHTHIHGKPTQDQQTAARHTAWRNRQRHRRNRFHGDRNGG